MKPLMFVAAIVTCLMAPHINAATPVPAEREDFCGDPLPCGAVARLGTVRYRVAGDSPVLALQFSQDSSLVRAGLSAWDVRAGQLRPALPLPKEDFHTRLLGFTGDGKLALYTQSSDAKSVPADSNGLVLKLRDSEKGNVIRQLEGGTGRGWPGGARFSPDGSYAAVIDLDMRVGGWTWGTAYGFAVWDIRSGKKIIAKRNPVSGNYPTIGGLDFSPDGKRLALAGGDGVIRVYDLPGGGEIATCDTKARQLYAPRFVDRQTLCVAANDGVFVWKLDQPKPTLWKANTQNVYDIAISPDRKYLAAATWKGLFVFAMADGKAVVAPDEGPLADEVLSVAFSGDGRLLAFSRGQRVEMLETGAWKPAHSVEAHAATIQAMDVSRDGPLIATGDYLGVIRLWDSRGKPLKTFRHKSSQAPQLAISPDGKTLASPVGLWDIDSGKLRTPYDSDARYLLRFTSDGRQILEIGQNAILWRDTANGGVKRTIKPAEHCEITGASMSADGGTLVWSEADERQREGKASSPPKAPVYTAHVYDVPGQKAVAQYQVGPRALSLSPDGKRLAVGEDVNYSERPARPHVTIRNTLTGETLKSILVEPGYPSLLEWSPDGRLLAAEFRDNVIRLYETRDFTKVGQFTGHTNYIQRICWFADSRKLASAGYDTTGLVWNIADSGIAATRESKGK